MVPKVILPIEYMKQFCIVVALFFVSQLSQAQCAFQILDQDLVPSNTPAFEQCNSDGNDNFEITLFTTVELSSFTIDWGDGTAVTTTPTPWEVGTGITHTYTTLGTFNFTVTNTLGSCSGESVTGTVVSQRKPRIEFNVKASTITEGCANVDVFTFENTSSNLDNLVTFEWDFGDGSAVANANTAGDAGYPGTDITRTFLPLGGDCQPEVTLTANFGCGDGTGAVSRDGFITVFRTNTPNPDADIQFLCENTDITLTDLTTAACGANAPGRFTRWDLTSVGTALPASHTPAVFNTTQVIQLPAGAMTGNTYTVTLSDSNRCGVVTQDLTISVVEPPTASFVIDGITNDTLCQNTDYDFNASSSTGAAGSTLEYSWSFNGGSSYTAFNTADAIFTNDYSAIGASTVELVVQTQNGALCLDTVELDIDVIGAPVADFSFATVDNDSCGMREINFTDNSSPGSGSAITSYSWDFDNGDPLNTTANPSGIMYTTGVSNTTYNPTLTVTNTQVGTQACTDDFTLPITVYNFPSVTADIDTSCFGFPTTFLNTTTGTSSYQWDFDINDGTVPLTSSIPASNLDTTYTYTATGNFTSRLIVDNGACIDSADFNTVFVFDTVEANFSIDIDEGCHPLDVEITNSSKGAITYLWDFAGEGTSNTSSALFTQTFNNADSVEIVFPISLIIQAGVCADTLLDTVTVYDNPSASFSMDIPNPQCSPLTITFDNETDISTGDSTFQWYFGAGSPSTLATTDTSDITSVYTNTSFTINLDTISLVATSPEGCTDSVSQSISIFPEPQITLDPSVNDGCSPLQITFTPSEPIFMGVLDYGDGSDFDTIRTSATPQVNTFYRDTLATTDTTFNVQMSYISSFGCPDSTDTTITLRRVLDPALNYTIQDSTTIVTVTDASNGEIDDYIYDWNETGVDNDTNTTGTQVHQFAEYGTQVISYTVSNAHCSRQIDSVIFIPSFIPIPDFTVDTATGCLPVTIQFTNATHPTGAGVTYQWNFGDPNSGSDNTSTAENPTHIYTEAGNYTVTLAATNTAGSATKDTITSFIEILATPTASFDPRPPLVYLPNPVTFLNQSSNADTYIWDFGNGDGSTDINPSYQYSTPGTYTVTLIAQKSVCSDTFQLASGITAEEGEGVVLIPSVFTPNGDGVNDIFVTEVAGVTQYSLLVFNRWGSLIFQTNDPLQGWDGRTNGKNSPLGVYVYRVEYTNPNGQIEVKTGEINLLR